ncbi:DUF4998 domain-containing protein [Botryobacter ruber]|uniref:DUF4998 domain-containing protein n=1 Tax=Botryobacter ruber TaxID=2171629 RepID=UPI003743755C
MSYIAIGLSVILLNAGCQKEIEPPVVVEKEIEKVTSVKTYPGRNRVKLWWKLPADERVVKSKVTWNDETQSREIPVVAGKDTLSVLIENLEEGNYTFALYALDKEGKQSGMVIVNAKAYGNEFETALQNRAIKKVNFDASSSAAEIEWESAGLGVVGAEVKYTDAAATTHTLSVTPFTRNTTLSNFTAGESFRYRTLHLPNSSAIDTFFTAFETVIIEQASAEEEPSPTKAGPRPPIPITFKLPGLYHNPTGIVFLMRSTGSGFIKVMIASMRVVVQGHALNSG